MIDEDQSPPDARAVKREEESEREIEAFNTTRARARDGPLSTLDDRGYIVLGSASSCLGTYLLVCWLPHSTLARRPSCSCLSFHLPCVLSLPAGSLPGGGASAVRFPLQSSQNS